MKFYRLSTTALIISTEEMEDIIKIVKSLQESGLLIKAISEAIKNETKEQKGRFPPMIFVTLAASILRNALSGRGEIRAGEGVLRAVKFNAPSSFRLLLLKKQHL